MSVATDKLFRMTGNVPFCSASENLSNVPTDLRMFAIIPPT
jgi:hypothetical protein